MIPVIDRYFIRQIAQTLAVVSTVLLLIFLSNRVVRYLAEAATGELPPDLILTLVGLKIIKYLILVLPLALYLAILLVLGRMYRDSEMAALAACGVGMGRLYRPVVLVALPLAVLIGGFSLQVVPWSDRLEQQLIEGASRHIQLSALRAGRFHEGPEGDRVIYVESIGESGRRMDNIFIHVQRADGDVIISSKQASLTVDPDSGARYLVLENGYRYEGIPGTGDYRRIAFERHGVRIDARAPAPDPDDRDVLPSAALWNSGSPADLAELQWRLSVPVAAVTLALLALPLGRVRPRKGMYARLFVAVLIYVMYFNLITLAQSWTARGTIPPLLGVWWVHALVLALTAALVIRHYGWSWVRLQLGGRSRPS